MRLDVIERYNQEVSPAEKIRQFTLVKEPVSELLQRDQARKGLPSLIHGIPLKSRPVDEPDFPEYPVIKDFLQQLLRRRVFPDDHLEIDLAVSSLEKVQLSVFLEETFGINLTERELLTHFSVTTLAQYVRQQRPSHTSEQLPRHVTLEVVQWGKILRDHRHLTLPETRVTLTILLKSTELFTRSYFRLQAEGLEYLPESPMILVANHQCFFDGFIMARFLSSDFMKNSYALGGEKHFQTPFRRFVANTANIIIVNINRDLSSALRKMGAVLEQGSNLFIFPEGTRTKDGRLGQFKPTFAILSREFQVPIVPTVIRGGFEAMPVGGGFPKPFKPIRVTFLPPVFPAHRPYQDIAEQVRREIKQYVF
jgi:long-chain acyl-CoA synthetase